MKAFHLLLAVALCQVAMGQESVVPSTSPYTYQGPCCDETGKPSNPADPTLQAYNVKSFGSTTPVEIVVKSIIVGKTRLSIDLNYKGEIASETDVIQVTDSLGLKLVLAQMRENGLNKYIYKLILFRKDASRDCWRPLINASMMLDVYEQITNLGPWAIGDPNSKDYLMIEEAWMKLN